MSRPRGRPRIITCFLCGKPVKKTDKKFYIPIEHPYTNILVHLHCFKNTSKKVLKTKLNEYFKTIYGKKRQQNSKSIIIKEGIDGKRNKKRATKKRVKKK